MFMFHLLMYRSFSSRKYGGKPSFGGSKKGYSASAAKTQRDLN